MDALLFDMDGTLIDSEHLWLEAEIATMASLGSAWTDEDQAYSLGGPMERVIAYMVDKAGGGHDHGEVTATLLGHMERLLRSEHIPWRPGARELLQEAIDADLPRALVSASWRTLVDAMHEEVLHEVGRNAFPVTVAGDEVKVGKPDPAPYLLAARRLGVDPRRCVVLEDSPTGVTAGRASGALVVAVPHMVPIEPGERCVVVPTLEGVTLADLERWLAEA